MDHDNVGRGRPRLGFVGLGPIGRVRLAALTASGAAEAAALCDPDPERLCAAVPGHRRAGCFDDAAELLAAAGDLGLEGVVVAMPPAAAVESIELTLAALERDLAVLCQTSLVADAAGCRRAVTAARRADRLLGVDHPYRGLPGVARAVRRTAGGLLGPVMHVRGAFYGSPGPAPPGRPETAAAGGGAFLDLGVHLLDLALALLGRPEIDRVATRCFRNGRLLAPPVIEAEDFAAVHLEFAGGPSADLVASRSAHAGADCAFRLEAFGTRGGLELVDRGPEGFEVAVREGRRRTVVARAGDAERSAAAVAWARRLAAGPGFDPAVAGSVAVAETLESIYGRRAWSGQPRAAERSTAPRRSAPAVAGALASA